MKKLQKKQALEYIKLLDEVHEEVKKAIDSGRKEDAIGLLQQCQEGAIQLGEFIESIEGEGTNSARLLEKYCEIVFGIYEEINQGKFLNIHKVYKNLQKQRLHIENSIKDDIPERKEIVFLPYKASMWDSLESIWMAANEDENCDAYVVPIPYYDKNPDGTLGQIHYEGLEFPEDVPILWYEDYNLAGHKPDVIYIHNPYDGYNFVTSVDPRFYSKQLKQYTDCLVYVPYYTTSGGMGEAQSLCSAYLYADYIIMQAEKYRGFFDSRIPTEKFVALGSPKFDKIIRMCNEPKKIPDNWKEQMEEKRVYFYNTSITGMLADTENFLKKMEYVFDHFRDREDVCILWRPHPLLESTFSSMKKEYLPEYERIKADYIDNRIGIYDDTPDMNQTIPLCDAYIGDSGSSVTSIFGMVGKPVFILNNRIQTKPEADDWKGSIIKEFSRHRNAKWMVTQGNKLYYTPKEDYKYEYYCNLSEYGGGNYYGPVYEVEGKIIVCPLNAQDILVIQNKQIVRKISLKKYLVKPGAFREALKIKNKIYLIPYFYPAIVVLDIEEEIVDYIEGYEDFYIQMVQGEWRVGGCCVWKENLLIASPTDNRILILDGNTQKTDIFEINTNRESNALALFADEEYIWSLPYSGMTIVCWNPKNGEVKEYKDFPKDFYCKNKPWNEVCMEKPFGSVVFDQEYIYLAPCWGNQFIRLNKKSGTTEKWIPPFPLLEKEKNGYFFNHFKGTFICKKDALGEDIYTYFSVYDCRMFDVNMRTKEYREIEINFKAEELVQNESGFSEISEWQQYICEETAINSLEDLLNETIKGNLHDKEKQIAAYGKVAANNDGTCGKKIHRFVCG